MGAPLKKVQPGDKLRIPASTFNTFIDVADAWKGEQLAGGRGLGTADTGRQFVLIVNESGDDVDRFGILGIDGPAILPSENADEFENRIVLAGVTPTSDHFGRFAIVLEPLADGAIGRACIAGVCQVKIDMSDEGHGFAEVADGETGHLVSMESGSATILWFEPFGEEGPGEKWAVVRLGNAAAFGPRLTYTFYADLNSDTYNGGVWSGGDIDPLTVGETKDCWNETGGESYNPIRFRWIPVRAGTIRRVSAYMTNCLIDGCELQVYPLWRAAGAPCPSDDVNAMSAAVTLTGSANIGHSALLSQGLGDDYLLSIRLKAGAMASAAGYRISGDGLLWSASPNGDYRPYSTLGGKTAYRCGTSSSGWWLWWNVDTGRWEIGYYLGWHYHGWQKATTGDPPTGSYQPFGDATGNPEAAEATVSRWGYVNPTDPDRPIIIGVVEYDTSP